MFSILIPYRMLNNNAWILIQQYLICLNFIWYVKRARCHADGITIWFDSLTYGPYYNWAVSTHAVLFTSVEMSSNPACAAREYCCITVWGKQAFCSGLFFLLLQFRYQLSLSFPYLWRYEQIEEKKHHWSLVRRRKNICTVARLMSSSDCKLFTRFPVLTIQLFWIDVAHFVCCLCTN